MLRNERRGRGCADEADHRLMDQAGQEKRGLRKQPLFLLVRRSYQFLLF